MARLFPSKLTGTVAPETATVFHALRRIPGDDVLVWIALPIFAEWRPALMVIDRRESGHLIAVSALTEAQVVTALYGDLFASAEKGVRPADVERGLRERLVEFRRAALAACGGGDWPVAAVVAFPNVPQALLDDLAHRGEIRDCELWGRETLRTETLLRRLATAATGGRKLSEAVVAELRAQFSPEMGIPESLVARVPEKAGRATGPRLTGFLLDLDQEFLAKEDLALTAEAEAAVREMRVRLVTGVAGSGKSLILLYRAMLQARLHPEAKMLILTHNRPLNGELQERFRRLCPGAGAQWETFFSWCSKLAGVPWKIIKPWEQEPLLRDLAAEDRGLAQLPLKFLGEELDWIREQGLAGRAEYLAVARLGRRRPLHDEQRHAVFSLLEKYCAELRRRGEQDWVGVAAAVWQEVQSGRIAPPVYDFIFVDEAQFFAPVWFQIVKRGVRPESGQLFLAADPTQGFLKRRQSWAASGLEVRGHSARLGECYRNTREILQLAVVFYQSRLPPDEEEINLPEPEKIARQRSGEAPEFLRVDSGQGELARVANEIAAAVRAGANPGHMLVLQSDWKSVAPFIETLNRTVGRDLGHDPKDRTYRADMVRVSALDAATGLESPVVFLCGVDGLFEREDALGLDRDERSELVRDNTRRIYMGMTRASQRLLVTYRRPATRKCLEGGGV